MMCKHCGKQIKDVSQGVCTACGQVVKTGATGNGFYDILTGNQVAVQSGGAGGTVRNEEEGFFVSRDLMTELINAQKTTNKYLKRQTEYKRMAIIISLVALVVTIALTISFILFSINFEGSKEGTQKTTDAPRETIGVRGGNGGNGGGAPTATPVPTEKPEETPEPLTKAEILQFLTDLQTFFDGLHEDIKNEAYFNEFANVMEKAEGFAEEGKLKDAVEKANEAYTMLLNHEEVLISGTEISERIKELKQKAQEV